VVSTTLQQAEWGPTKIIRRDVPAEVARLKQQYDGEIQVHRQRRPGPDAALPRPHRQVPAVHRAGRAGHRQADVRAGRHADGLRLVESTPMAKGTVLANFQPAGKPTYGEFQMEEGFGLPDT
jgi:hypothetical protein